MVEFVRGEYLEDLEQDEMAKATEKKIEDLQNEQDETKPEEAKEADVDAGASTSADVEDNKEDTSVEEVKKEIEVKEENILA